MRREDVRRITDLMNNRRRLEDVRMDMEGFEEEMYRRSMTALALIGEHSRPMATRYL